MSVKEQNKILPPPKDLLMGFTETLVLQIPPWLCLCLFFLKAPQYLLFARHLGHEEGKVL